MMCNMSIDGQEYENKLTGMEEVKFLKIDIFACFLLYSNIPHIVLIHLNRNNLI